MATIDLSDTPFRSPRLYKIGFWRLPRELRDIVYAYVLVQPDYFSKRHIASCKFSDHGCVNPEPPPFMTRCPSRCSRRHGLGLLLANRQTYNEAAPIFWGRNMHFFKNPATFSENVGKLSNKCREYLQHVHIGYTTRSQAMAAAGRPYLERDGMTRAMWETILLCKNLRILELEPQFLKYHIHPYPKIRANLPHLESVAMAEIHEYPCRSSNLDSISDRFIWIKITKKILLGQKKFQLLDAIRDFSTNHVVHVNFEVNKEFLRPPQWTWPGATAPILAPHLKDNNNVQTVTLRDRTVTDLTIYGLPNSRATRASYYRQRLFEQNRRKAAGLPRAEEVEVAARMKKTREEKKVQLEIEEECTRERGQREKKLEQEKFREEQMIAESKNRENQRIHKQRNIRMAEKLKQEERKKVPKIS